MSDNTFIDLFTNYVIQRLNKLKIEHKLVNSKSTSSKYIKLKGSKRIIRVADHLPKMNNCDVSILSDNKLKLKEKCFKTIDYLIETELKLKYNDHTTKKFNLKRKVDIN